MGRRCGLGGRLANADDDQVNAAFRSGWGIGTDSAVLKSITFPTADVISQAPDLFQSDLRKPSYTVWVVDYSGSMYGEGKDGVVNGLSQALEPTQAAQSMIQPAEVDVNVLVPFSSTVGSMCTANGSDTSALLLFLVPGIVGIVAGAAVAVLLYLGLALVLKPHARLGNAVASSLPDGEAAAARVADAQALLRDIAQVEAQVHKPSVRDWIRQL